jgi:hypothetical protein
MVLCACYLKNRVLDDRTFITRLHGRKSRAEGQTFAYARDKPRAVSRRVAIAPGACFPYPGRAILYAGDGVRQWPM